MRARDEVGRSQVSIRSPHRSEERSYIGASVKRRSPAFQSAPLTEARRDTTCSATSSPKNCFNPLPSPKRGEIPSPWCLSLSTLVSIRSPHRSEERSSPVVAGWRSCVSIRSPHRSEERFDLVVLDDPSGNSFNPLPSPKRGEIAGCCRAGGQAECFNPLPSPKRGEIPPRTVLAACLRFNPLPSPKRGEILPARVSCGSTLVSIRSPHRSEERSHVGRPSSP